DHPQRQSHVLEGRHVVEQPEILKHDADAPPQRSEVVLAERGGIVAEQRDQPPRGPQRKEQQTQKRGLAGARGAGEELKRTRLDANRKLPARLGPLAIAQPSVLEPDHLPRPKEPSPPGGPAVWRPASTRPYGSESALRRLPLLRAWASNPAMRR